MNTGDSILDLLALVDLVEKNCGTVAVTKSAKLSQDEIEQRAVEAFDKEYEEYLRELERKVIHAMKKNAHVCAEDLALVSEVEKVLGTVDSARISEGWDRRKRRRVRKADSCGANAPGGGGFQPGNTCGSKTRRGDSSVSSKFKGSKIGDELMGGKHPPCPGYSGLGW